MRRDINLEMESVLFENNMVVMYETDEAVENEKRRACPKCKSTFEYHGAKDSDTCPICESYVTVV